MSKVSNGFELQGELTHREVSALYKNTLRFKRGGELPEVIDLAQVSRCDSSALALLLEWLSWARARKGGLRFANPPENLVTIARLCQVDEVLGFAGKEA